MKTIKKSKISVVDVGVRGMFDVADKSDTLRIATAQAVIRITPLTSKMIKEGRTPKGNIFDAARIAATMAAKRTSDLIPYCHPIPIDDVKVRFSLKDNDCSIEIKRAGKNRVEDWRRNGVPDCCLCGFADNLRYVKTNR